MFFLLNISPRYISLSTNISPSNLSFVRIYAQGVLTGFTVFLVLLVLIAFQLIINVSCWEVVADNVYITKFNKWVFWLAFTANKVRITSIECIIKVSWFSLLNIRFASFCVNSLTSYFVSCSKIALFFVVFNIFTCTVNKV